MFSTKRASELKEEYPVFYLRSRRCWVLHFTTTRSAERVVRLKKSTPLLSPLGVRWVLHFTTTLSTKRAGRLKEEYSRFLSSFRRLLGLEIPNLVCSYLVWVISTH
ncbi:hypothetical protein AVEN_136605-1 [Araneus ventricosus]|uniref:Uncharacterized protein n=1 Tax=Araneus ventricosus TaxID=182803 RepID=A0A4Y2U792_ARAVE|nr:hypothetical protein AVEN_136605-1 [Araneus ventricosus]